MLLLLLLMLASAPVDVVRIEASIVTVTSRGAKTSCAIGPHAKLYRLALDACRPTMESKLSVIELSGDKLTVFATEKQKALGKVTCAVRPDSSALKNEAEACVLGLR